MQQPDSGRRDGYVLSRSSCRKRRQQGAGHVDQQTEHFEEGGLRGSTRYENESGGKNAGAPGEDRGPVCGKPASGDAESEEYHDSRERVRNSVPEVETGVFI